MRCRRCSPISRAAPPALRSPPAWRPPSTRARAARCRLAHRRHARPVRRQLPAVRERAQALGRARRLVRRPVAGRRALRGGAAARTRGWCGSRRPTNPLLKLVDLSAVAALARERGIIAVCDNTFATPLVQRPLEHGFDIVVHSTTKYLNGHSDAIGGAAIVRQRGPSSRERIGYLQNAVGGVPGPFDCVPDAARHQDARAAHGAALRQRARHRAVPGAAPQGRARLLPRARQPSPARAGAAPDERRLRRHRDCGAARRSARGAPGRSSAASCSRWPRAWAAWRASSSIPAIMTHASLPGRRRAPRSASATGSSGCRWASRMSTT